MRFQKTVNKGRPKVCIDSAKEKEVFKKITGVPQKAKAAKLEGDGRRRLHLEGAHRRDKVGVGAWRTQFNLKKAGRVWKDR